MQFLAYFQSSNAFSGASVIYLLKVFAQKKFWLDVVYSKVLDFMSWYPRFWLQKDYELQIKIIYFQFRFR